MPAVPAVALLVMDNPDEPGHQAYPLYSRTTDKATIAKIVRLVNEQTEPVADGAACARHQQKGVRLDLGTAHVVVALGPDCQEAVSSQGGRVRFDAAAVAELEKLFGIVR